MVDQNSRNPIAAVIELIARVIPRADVCRNSALIIVGPPLLFATPIGTRISERASDAMLVIIFIAWLAAIVVGQAFCWKDRVHQRSHALAQTPAPHSPNRPLLVLFLCLVLLITTAGLVVLFASGELRFGLEGPFVFFVYVLAGLLAALICFGILYSHAQASGEPYGVNLMLGGPIVALLLVAGGGAIYEQHIRPPSTLAVRVYFYENDRTERVPVAGTFSLELPNRSLEQKIDGAGGVSFMDLPPSLNGQSVPYSLRSTDYKIHPEERTDVIALSGQRRVLLRVKRKLPAPTALTIP